MTVGSDDDKAVTSIGCSRQRAREIRIGGVAKETIGCLFSDLPHQKGQQGVSV